MIYIVIFVVVAISVIQKAFKAELRGRYGERAVRKKLAVLPKEKYIVFNDIMVKTERGTSQIDHVVVSQYGIFVIETKNYNGMILGGENSDEWTQNIYGKKYRFRNPLKQNYGHVKALESVLALPKEYFIPIVVFMQRANLKVKTAQRVTTLKWLINAIYEHKELVLTQEEVDEIVKKINNLNITGSRREHVSDIQSNVRAANEKIKSGICPKCGGALRLRRGKYGDFYGCSNYPKCKFTKKEK